MLSYRRETVPRGASQFSPKVEYWNREAIFYRHYRSIVNHCDIIGLKICRIQRKKRKIRAITAFKVIESHRGRSLMWCKIWTNLFRFVIYAFDEQTDGRTDRWIALDHTAPAQLSAVKLVKIRQGYIQVHRDRFFMDQGIYENCKFCTFSRILWNNN